MSIQPKDHYWDQEVLLGADLRSVFLIIIAWRHCHVGAEKFNSIWSVWHFYSIVMLVYKDSTDNCVLWNVWWQFREESHADKFWPVVSAEIDLFLVICRTSPGFSQTSKTMLGLFINYKWSLYCLFVILVIDYANSVLITLMLTLAKNVVKMVIRVKIIVKQIITHRIDVCFM